MTDQNQNDVTIPDPAGNEWGRNRKRAIEGADLDPLSLLGSWFHKLEGGVIVWQGLVVGEPRQGVYLLAVDRLDVGADNVQILADVESMLSSDDDLSEWRFYDDRSQATDAYVAWLTTESARAEA